MYLPQEYCWSTYILLAVYFLASNAFVNKDNLVLVKKQEIFFCDSIDFYNMAAVFANRFRAGIIFLSPLTFLSTRASDDANS